MKGPRGYVLVRSPGHHRQNKAGYVLEHILVAEAALGHPLPPRAEIHHVDEVRSNNSPGNLVICPGRAYHFLLHERQRALDACGDANALHCYFCHQYDAKENIVVVRDKRTGEIKQKYHLECRRSDTNRRWRDRAKGYAEKGVNP